MPRFLTIVLATLLLTVAGNAQTTSNATFSQSKIAHPKPKPSTKIPTDWPYHYDRGISVAMDVVTTADPGHQQRCESVAILADTLTCYPPHHSPDKTYSRSDVLALISRPTHTCRNYFLILVGIAAADIAASFFVPLAAAVTLRVLAGLVLWAGPVGLMGADPDHGEEILYQKPGTTFRHHYAS